MVLLDGVHIGKGAGVKITNFRIRNDSLLENTEAFLSRNKSTAKHSTVTYAGETLAVYNSMDYLQEINEVIRFVESALSEDWDNNLTNLCEVCWAKPD